jgi:hypothetical protein
MATIKKAAKKAVPKVKEEPKQIVLTRDQYNKLVDFKWELSRISYEIKDTCTDEDSNSRKIAFELGALQIKLDKIYTDLGTILIDIDPEPLPDWEDNDYDKGYN